MESLLQHILSPYVQVSDDLEIDIQDADSSVIVTLSMTDADKERLLADDKVALQSIRHLLSVASGPKKPILRFATDDMGGEESSTDDNPKEEDTQSTD